MIKKPKKKLLPKLVKKPKHELVVGLNKGHKITKNILKARNVSRKGVSRFELLLI